MKENPTGIPDVEADSRQMLGILQNIRQVRKQLQGKYEKSPKGT